MVTLFLEAIGFPLTRYEIHRREGCEEISLIIQESVPMERQRKMWLAKAFKKLGLTAATIATISLGVVVLQVSARSLL